MVSFQSKKYFINLSSTFILIICLFFVLFPFIWLVLTSLKSEIIAFSIPPVWFFKPTGTNYLSALTQGPFLRSYYNSLIVGLSSTLLSLLVGIPVSYLLARTNIRGERAISFGILLTRMAPPVAILLPFYIIMRTLGLLDTRSSVVITYLSFNLPFVIWMMRGFFKEVPLELEEAAWIDGCSRLQAIFKILLPLSLPGIATAAIFCFIASWNEFLFAAVLTGTTTKTAPVVIQNFMSFEGARWGTVCAAGTMVALPILAFSMAVQRNLIRGLTLGAIK